MEFPVSVEKWEGLAHCSPRAAAAGQSVTLALQAPEDEGGSS